MKFKLEAASDLLEALAQNFPEASKTTLRQMLQQGRVSVNGDTEKGARRAVAAGDEIAVGRRTSVANLTTELALLFEDDDIIVIIKNAGMLTVGTADEKEKTAQRYLNEYLRTKRGSRVHVVHRLDRDTSGVMMFAKNFETREILKDTFAAHDIDRVYVAIVEGKPPQKEGTIKSYLFEDDRMMRVRSVADPKQGKLAITHYRVLEAGGKYAKLEVTLETGRKNQIRVHFSEQGFPVAGDTRYGAKTDPLGRLGLHAQMLGFVHPKTKKKMIFTAPLPDVFRKIDL